MDMKDVDKLISDLEGLSNKQLAGRMMARGANEDVPLEVRMLVIEAAFRLSASKAAPPKRR